MSRQRQKGTAFENLCAQYLSDELGVEVRRNPLLGALDQGDLSGIVIGGDHFTVECKDYSGKYRLAEWSEELEREMFYCSTDKGCVVFKIAGKGEKSMGEQGVYMKLKHLVALLKEAHDGHQEYGGTE